MQQPQYASQADTRQIWTWNAKVPGAINGLLHGLFVAKATETPDALAVDAWDFRFTYAELDRATTRLASHLVHVGRVEPGMLVPICFEKSAWAIVAMLSVLKAGAAFVPLDPAQPALRRAKILRQLGDLARVAIASVSQAKILGGDGRRVVVVGPSELERLQEDHLPPITVAADGPAYCLFTSGSTGEPKGVIMEHGAVVSSQIHRRDFKGYNKDSRVFQFSSYTFDTCIDEIFMTLGVGGCVCVPSEEERMNRLASTIHNMSVNLLEVTTTVAALISPDEVPLVKTIIFGGEFLSHAAFAPWEGKARVINSYGPTECCVDCVFSDFTTTSAPGLLGTSAGSVTWVVDPDDHNHLLPVGAIGELLIEGPVLAKAYLNSPEKTAQAFVQDPEWLLRGVDDRPGRNGRLYKTGDLVKYAADGKIVYVGRKDTQVKIHGQRVELGEIEVQISEHMPRGTRVIAEVVSYEDGTQALVAFVRSSSERASSESYGNSDAPISLEPMGDATSLQRKLSSALPGYMVPAGFFIIREFPMNTSGKVDRKILREEAAQRGIVDNTGENALRPISSREQKLQQIFADILKVERSRIGVNDSFFELGGTSVAAIKLAGQARKQGMKLAVADIFQYPRLCDLAAKASSKLGKTKDLPIAPFSLLGSSEEGRLARDRTAASYSLETDAIEDLFPCTPLQEGMLSLTSRDTGSEYMVQRVLHISPNMDTARFRAAWEIVIEQLPALRTKMFLSEDGTTLLQGYVKDAVQWKQANNLDEYLRSDRAIPMELGDRLVRYAIVGEGQDRYFVWTIHHCIYDGWTMPRMIALVERAYAQQSLSLGQHANFNSFVKNFLNRNVEEAKKFWTSYLAGAEATKIPNRVYQPDSAESRGFAECRRPLPFSNSKNHVPTTIIRAAMGIVLGQLTGSDDIVFGTVVSGRQCAIDDIQDIMGPTLATVPVRLRIDPSKTKGQFLDSVQNDAIAVVPFEQEGIQSIAGFDASCRDACNFQVYLAVQQDDPDSFDSGALGQWQCELGRPNGVSTYPIMVECYLEGDGLNIQATFDPETVSSSEMDRIIDHFFYILEQLLQGDLSQKLDDIDPVSPTDLQRILAWNVTVPVLVEETLHDISLRKTRSTPDATAVDAWDGRLTYSELELATSYVADLLVQAGVGPDVMVPICFEKSVWAVVAMLAILKAGGAFVPLDPKQPKLRRETVIMQIPCPVMVASAANAGLLEADGRDVMVVGPSVVNIQQLRSSQGHSNSAVPKNISPASAAYTLFTSGSTGEPKGVVIQHQAISSSLLSRAEGQGYGPHTRVLQFASYTFDAMVDEIFMTLVCGGCICIPSDEDAMSDINGSIRNFEVNSLALTATILRLINPEEVPDVDSVIFWGEAVSQQDLNRWCRVPESRTPRLQVRYGPTECCVTCTHYEVDLERLPRGNPIGKAVGSRSWVVDSKNHDRLVPVGGIGELLIEGPAQARWYLNDQARTDAAFIHNPKFLTHNPNFHDEQAGRRRLYKTGDLVRYDYDGNLIYMGRKDAQIKLNGQRVELGEIESHLASCVSGASHVLADIVTLESGQRMLATFIKFDTNENATVRDSQLAKPLSRAEKLEIESKMSQRVPRHMIPSLFFVVQRVPHTLTGKLDRKLLREEAKRVGLQSKQQEKGENTASIPMTEREKKMQQVWCKILNLEPSAIHVNDTFFQLGGHSVTAMKVAAEARKHKMGVTVADIFQNPRLRDLAAVASSSTSQKDDTIAPFSLLPHSSEHQKLCHELGVMHGLEEDAFEDLLPCTPLQEGLLSLTSRDTGDYLAQRVLRISDDISLDSLREAWEAVVHALPILRTRLFFTKDYGMLQGVLRRGIEWTHADSLEDYLKSDLAKSTGVGEPLNRYAIINGQSGQGRWLVWTMHHSLYDAWTLPRILDMVENAYRGVNLGQPGSFGVFIKYLMNRDTEKTRQFWQDYLSGARRLRLVKPTQTTESPARGFLQSERATKFNNDRHVPATFVHAAVGILLSQLSGGLNDVTFASTVFGRACPVDGIENVMGPTIATIPVRVQFQSGQPVRDLLDKLQSHATSMVPYEQEGIQNIRRMSQSCRNACEFQAYLVVKQDDPAYPDEPGSGLFGEWQEGPEQSELTTYPIMMECRVHDEGFKVRMSVSTEVAGEHEMNLLMDQFHSVLEQLLQSSSSGTMDDIVSTPISGLNQVWAWDSDDSLSGNNCAEPSICNGLNSRTNRQTPPMKNQTIGPAGSPAKILHRIWADALGLDPSTFGMEDNLFYLGGDSIAAMKVAAAARACGCKITVSNLLRSPTIFKQLPHFSVSPENGMSDKSCLMNGSAEKLQRIWAGALGLDLSEVGMEDNFFHLGGDSVIAMKVAAAVRASGWSITVSDILKFPTISQQLPNISVRKAQEPVLAIPRPYSLIPAGLQEEILKRLGEDGIRNAVLDILPTTDFQSMTVTDNMQAPRTARNYFSLDLGPSVDHQRLEDACKALVGHLEILRTVFVCARGKVWSVVLKSLPVALARITSENEDFVDLHHMIRNIGQNKPFDHPVVSFTLAHVPSVGYKLLIGISHAQYDGLSVPSILRVLESSYNNNVAPTTIPFSAFFNLQSKRRALSRAYWRTLLKSSSLAQGLPRLSSGLPPKAQPRKIEVNGTVELPAIPEGFTVAVVANLAWALLLHTTTGDEDIVYVTLASGRSHPVRGIEGVVGPCITLVPVRLVFSKLWAASELAACVQEQFLALDHGDTMGIDEIREHCTDWPAQPAFDSVFFHQGVSDSPEHFLAGAPVKAQSYLNPAVEIRRTTVTTKQLGDGLGVTVQSSSSLMTDRDAVALVDAFSAAFSVVCRNL